MYTLNECDEKQYNDLLESQSVLMDAFLARAFPMFAKSTSQPLSDKSFNCLLLARLLSTRCHPPSSCKKGTRINKTSALQRVGGEVRNYMRVYVYVMCDKWTVTHLHILFEGEAGMLNNDGIGCSITIVHCV